MDLRPLVFSQCQLLVTPAFASVILQLKTISANINTHAHKQESAFHQPYPLSKNFSAAGKNCASYTMKLCLLDLLSPAMYLPLVTLHLAKSTL
jgi:hypothetical protein